METISISKALLSEVLNEGVNERIVLEGSIIKYSYKYLGYAEINIYELAHKCKEWALSKGYILDSQTRGYCSGRGICFVYKDDWTSEYEEYCLQSFTGDSEIEAVIKACEWILKCK